MLPMEALPDRVERAGSQVAKDDAQGAEGKEQKFAVQMVLGIGDTIL